MLVWQIFFVSSLLVIYNDRHGRINTYAKNESFLESANGHQQKSTCLRFKKVAVDIFRGIKETYIVHTEKPAEILTYLALRKMIHFLFFKTKDITDRHYFISLVNKFQKYFILLCHLNEIKLKDKRNGALKLNDSLNAIISYQMVI